MIARFLSTGHFPLGNATVGEYSDLNTGKSLPLQYIQAKSDQIY